MDSYQTPAADLRIDLNNKRVFKPAKALVFGLLISFVLDYIVKFIIVGIFVHSYNEHLVSSLPGYLPAI